MLLVMDLLLQLVKFLPSLHSLLEMLQFSPLQIIGETSLHEDKILPFLSFLESFFESFDNAQTEVFCCQEYFLLFCSDKPFTFLLSSAS